MTTRLFFLIVLLQTSFSLAQDYTFLGNYRSHQLQGNRLLVETANKPVELVFFADGVVRVTVGKAPSLPVELAPLKPVPVQLKDSEERLVATYSGSKMVIAKSPLRLRVLREDGSEVMADDASFGHGWNGNEVRVWKKLESDHSFYGLGEKSGDVNRRGRFFTNWNADTPAYRNDSDPLYCGIPFFSGMHEGRAFGLFLVNSHRSTFNLGAGNKRLFSFGAEAGSLCYYIFPGPSMKDVISAYTSVVGRMSLPPKWALGYQQCRWSYFPEYEVRDVAKEFRQRTIPCDVLYFDIHYMDAYKVFTWHPERFPDPRKLLQDLGDLGFKTVTIIDPGVKVERGYSAYEEGLADDHFLRYLDGELFQGQVWPGWCHFPDFRKAKTRAWWGRKNSELRNQGVDGFWNDMNEPALWGKEMPFVVEGIKSLHNVFGLLMARATYEGLLSDRPNLRPFIVTRAGWAGIQRYAAVWTGDNSASYDDLALSIRTNIGLGLSGVPFVGCDVGGFIGTPDSELYVRWMQAASLSPFMRSHTVYDTPDQEPWSYGEETERRCREAIERRYQLMPYLYGELFEAHETGLPIYRPVWLEFPEDQKSYSSEFQHQFMIGSHLLAAPVLRKGQRFQKVYLPLGRWYNVETGRMHEGGDTLLVEASLDTLPLFYREGAIIPTREVQQYVDQRPLQSLELTVVTGSESRQAVIVDDGVSFDGPSSKIDIQLRQSELEITVAADASVQSPEELKVRLIGNGGSGVRFSAGEVTKRNDWWILPAKSGTLSWK